VTWQNRESEAAGKALKVMKKNLRVRGIVIAVVTLLSLIVMLGPWNRPKEQKVKASDFLKFKQNLSENIKLGLDLKGGTHLVMQVQTEQALAKLTEDNKAKAAEILKKENIPFKDVKMPATGQVVVETENTNDHAKIKEKIQADFSTDWEAKENSSPPTVTFTLLNSVADYLRKQATEQAKIIVEQRVDQFGVAEPTIQLHGREEDHQILLQMPGLDNPDRVKKLLQTDTRLELKAVVGSLYQTREEALASLGGTEPSDKQIIEVDEKNADGRSSTKGFYVVERAPIVTGADLRNAQAVPNGQGMGYKINFQLKPGGAEKFGTWTGSHIGTQLAIVLINEVSAKVKSAPTIQGQISDSGEITGSFTQEDAEDLSLTLRSGALPTSIRYLEERTVGPSLGADSIRQGIIASIVGLVLVVSVMLLYYRFSGLNAVIGLVLNLLFLLAGMALFGATLTLPGIAGVILTIGMAVDSNVLIFERIREELRAGKIVASAVATGFDKALVTIIDTHVTTIVSAAFLYFFGTGPIRGFAVTLTIGLLANLFTAVYVSRSMFLWVLNRGGRKAETLSI
jgi:preprotein translocase subunit SecD